MSKPNLKNIDDILAQEFNFDFVNKMKQNTILGYHKYGPVGINAGDKLTSMIDNLKKNLTKFEETKNTEYLVSVAVYAMFEFTNPQLSGVYYRPTDSDESAGYSGKMSFREIEQL
jgi:hypothetical protein